MKIAFRLGRWYVLLWTLVLGAGIPIWGVEIWLHVHGPGYLFLLVAAPFGALFLGGFLGTILWRDWGRMLGVFGAAALLALLVVNAFFAREIDAKLGLLGFSAMGVLAWFFLPEVRSRFLAASEA